MDRNPRGSPLDLKPWALKVTGYENVPDGVIFELIKNGTVDWVGSAGLYLVSLGALRRAKCFYMAYSVPTKFALKRGQLQVQLCYI